MKKALVAFLIASVAVVATPAAAHRPRTQALVGFPETSWTPTTGASGCPAIRPVVTFPVQGRSRKDRKTIVVKGTVSIRIHFYSTSPGGEDSDQELTADIRPNPFWGRGRIRKDGRFYVRIQSEYFIREEHYQAGYGYTVWCTSDENGWTFGGHQIEIVSVVLEHAHPRGRRR